MEHQPQDRPPQPPFPFSQPQQERPLLEVASSGAVKDLSKIPARLAVKEFVYHQMPDGFPTEVEHVFCVEIKSAEDSFKKRRFTVGPEWMPLPAGGIEAASIVALVNLTATEPGLIPTPEQKAEMALLVVEVGVKAGVGIAPFALLHPTESHHYRPADLSAVRVRSRSGQPVDCLCFVVPA